MRCKFKSRWELLSEQVHIGGQTKVAPKKVLTMNEFKPRSN